LFLMSDECVLIDDLVVWLIEDAEYLQDYNLMK
jgi:hypothetical protein